MKFKITKKPVDVACPRKGCKGATWSVPLSRLEIGLGHEGYRCDACGYALKFIPSEGR